MLTHITSHTHHPSGRSIALVTLIAPSTTSSSSRNLFQLRMNRLATHARSSLTNDARLRWLSRLVCFARFLTDALDPVFSSLRMSINHESQLFSSKPAVLLFHSTGIECHWIRMSWACTSHVYHYCPVHLLLHPPLMLSLFLQAAAFTKRHLQLGRMVIIFSTPFFSAVLRISPVLSIPRGVSS
jgi:hypothetical protein